MVEWWNVVVREHSSVERQITMMRVKTLFFIGLFDHQAQQQRSHRPVCGGFLAGPLPN